MTHTGFFERYFITPFFRHATDFSGSAPSGILGYTLLAWLIVTAGVAGALLGLVGLLGPEVGFMALAIVGGLWLVWSIIAIASLLTRSSRSEDSDDATKKPVFLGIDKLLTVICILFLICGILMTVTTLNSGELNMKPRNGGDGSPNPILEQDSIWEEPIFTYQNEAPEEPVKDTMPDLEEKDTVSLDESFDPEIETSVPIEIDTAAIEL